MKLNDLTGKRYGRLTVIKRVDDYISPKGARSVRWLCKCDCGQERVVVSKCLQLGETKSCGCYRAERKFNDYYIKDDVAHLCFHGREILVDAEDIGLISGDGWHIGKNGYAASNSTKRTMHRVILNAGPDDVIDHINRIRTDNRRSNLRIATPSINGYNATRRPGRSGEKYIISAGEFYHVVIDGKYVARSRDIKDLIEIRDKAFEKSRAKQCGATL